MWQIVLHKRVVKYYKRLPSTLQKAVKLAFHSIETSPTESENISLMSGDWAGWSRMRVGQLRIIFWIDTPNHKVFIDHLGPRGDVYKK